MFNNKYFDNIFYTSTVRLFVYFDKTNIKGMLSLCTND